VRNRGDVSLQLSKIARESVRGLADLGFAHPRRAQIALDFLELGARGIIGGDSRRHWTACKHDRCQHRAAPDKRLLQKHVPVCITEPRRYG